MPQTDRTLLPEHNYPDQTGGAFSRYRLRDIGVLVLIYVAVSVLCGAMRPFPFDDETSTLRNVGFQDLSHSLHL